MWESKRKRAWKNDMCVLRRDMKGEIRVGYQYIDAVLDFILSIGAKPMIEFGHMPELLAEQLSQITMRPVRNAAPKDLEAWKRLIGGIMDHLRTPGVPCLAGNGGRGTDSFCSGTFEGT